MTTTTGADLDSTAGVLAAVEESRRAEDAEATRQMELAVKYASFHSVDSLDDAATLPGTEGEVALAGEGAPLVAEFAVVELAAVLGKSLDGGRLYLGECLELAHRLPRTWAAVVAGRCPGWRARRIASQTMHLPAEGASWVDAQVAPVAGRIGPVQTDRVVTEAIARFDPERAAQMAYEALEERRFDLRFRDVPAGGAAVALADLVGVLDAADAADLEAAVSAIAAQLAAYGSTASLDVRRSLALGVLSRGEALLPAPDDEEASTSPGLDGRSLAGARSLLDHRNQPDHRNKADLRTEARSTREVVLHVRLSEDALRGCGDGIGTWTTSTGRTLGQITVEQVQEWCTGESTRVTVRPVLDLEERIVSQGYQPAERLRAQTTTLHPRCVFPWCNRSSTRADLDHIDPWDPDGPPEQTASDTLAPLCRPHHRVKTHGGWTYTRIAPGEYLWASPHGHRFHVSTDGTTQLSDPPERPPRDPPRA